jgi:SagB-type dehydrogenase family enzyme
MLSSEDSRTLPLLYHINSEPWLNMEAYTDPSHEMQFKRIARQEAMPLPRSREDSLLRRLMRERRSCRSFTATPLPLAHLAQVLENAYGVTGLIEETGSHRFYARPVPSAGALYPLELYAVTQAVETLPDGVYHYGGLDHCLESVKQGSFLKNLGELLLGQFFLDNANAALVFTVVFDRTLRKYGPRGYRYILIEAGHVAQNVCLLAAELGLASICLGGFVDHRLNTWLGLDGTTEAGVYVVGLGYSHPQQADPP